MKNNNTKSITKNFASPAANELAATFKADEFTKAIDSEMAQHTKVFKKSAISFVKVVFELGGKKAESKEIPVPELPEEAEIKEYAEEIAKNICLAIGSVVDDKIGYDIDNMFLIDSWMACNPMNEEEELDELLIREMAKAMVKVKNINFEIGTNVDDIPGDEHDYRIVIGKMRLVVRAA